MRKNAWFLAWIHLDPLCYMSRDMYFLQGICLDPSLDPLGSSFTHLQKLRFCIGGVLVPGLDPLGSTLSPFTTNLFFARNLLGSWLGSTWIQFHAPTKTKVSHRKGCYKRWVPGLDPLGCTLLPLTKNVCLLEGIAGLLAWIHLVPVSHIYKN